jgi:aminoglycoside phosphotransferase (APT) family kinase protein
VTDVPDLGPVPQRVPVDADQVARMVAEQFPQWACLRVEPVARGGWDNWTFHLGDDLLVRMPSAAEYALAVEKEQRWLPVLAPLLPVAVPIPVGHGAPGPAYGLPWSVYRWLPGRTASAERIADPVAFAADLADVLVALQAVDATDGPQPGIHNWFRGATLRTYDATARGALGELAAHLDTDAVLATWTDVLGRGWDGVDRWFHGDVAAGNLLLDDDGRLSALIDFGTCGVGDPSCDLAVAWTLLTPDGRAVFRDRLAVDDDTWTRGRGWALWKALATSAAATGDERADGLRVVAAIVSDDHG